MVICQKEKCKEMHLIQTMNLMQQIDKMGLEIGRLSGENWTLNKKYKELKTNYTRLNNKYKKLKTKDTIHHVLENTYFRDQKINEKQE